MDNHSTEQHPAAPIYPPFDSVIDEIIDLAEIERVTGLSKHTVQRWPGKVRKDPNCGLPPFIRLGGRVLSTRRWLDIYMRHSTYRAPKK